MKYDVQVDAQIYMTGQYLSRSRWSTYARIIDEVLKLKPKSILEIGPGNGLVTDILRKIGFSVQTLDFDPAVKPDIIAHVTDPELPSLTGRHDLVIAAEVLEHITYTDALAVLRHLRNITPRLLLTLPYTSDHSRLFSFALKIPGVRHLHYTGKLFFRRATHTFNGQHYWEIGKKDFKLKKVRSDIIASGWQIERAFINPNNTYHYFFILKQS